MSEFQESVLHNDTLNKDPFELFDQWFKQAQASELNDPDAMALASVNSDGNFFQAGVGLLTTLGTSTVSVFASSPSSGLDADKIRPPCNASAKVVVKKKVTANMCIGL